MAQLLLDLPSPVLEDLPLPLGLRPGQLEGGLLAFDCVPGSSDSLHGLGHRTVVPGLEVEAAGHVVE